MSAGNSTASRMLSISRPGSALDNGAADKQANGSPKPGLASSPWMGQLGEA